MKRLIALVALVLVVDAGVAAAQEHYKGALGFHTSDAPLGVRWWLTDKFAFDAGVGFGSQEFSTGPTTTESVSNFTVDVGLPIMLRSWDKVHFAVRPGIAYHSQEVFGTSNNDITMTIAGELEAEVFLADNVSISASHGIAFQNFDPADPTESSTTDWGTTGANFTSLGFHVYLFGGR